MFFHHRLAAATISQRAGAVLVAAVLSAILIGPGHAQTMLAPAPEGATGRIVKSLGLSRKYMAAAANPLAAANVTHIIASQAGTVAASLKVGALYTSA